MAVVGESIENPVTGERITWVETAQSTGGELLAFDLDLRPGATVAAAHRHVRQEERFAVLSGTIEFDTANELRTVAEGGNVTVPAGVVHRWWNAGQDEARVRVELRPALDTETFFEGFFGLARDGKTNAKGIPRLLQIAVAYRELGQSAPEVPTPPPWVQRAVLTALAPVARLLGRRAVYPQYSPSHPSLTHQPERR